ncbi:hypothetical protein HPB50_021778 [Hyalomma asiaticum]|uniref:Uncharacterized protein n=1 Tax=Hyalomma asiaticum TaxID=266040 RepID=A0ACB7S8S8_HYAAI|nr:hypothetical protein HPB50_021778 [Hyalomma asiaticum]
MGRPFTPDVKQVRHTHTARSRALGARFVGRTPRLRESRDDDAPFRKQLGRAFRAPTLVNYALFVMRAEQSGAVIAPTKADQGCREQVHSHAVDITGKSDERCAHKNLTSRDSSTEQRTNLTATTEENGSNNTKPARTLPSREHGEVVATFCGEPPRYPSEKIPLSPVALQRP